MLHFYSPWCYQSFLMFAGGIEVKQWPKMGLKRKSDLLDLFSYACIDAVFEYVFAL